MGQLRLMWRISLSSALVSVSPLRWPPIATDPDLTATRPVSAGKGRSYSVRDKAGIRKKGWIIDFIESVQCQHCTQKEKEASLAF